MLCTDVHKALATLASRYEGNRIVVVMDRAVSLETAWPVLRLKMSETDKSLETVTRIWDFFFDNELTRRDLVISVGGGVLTDIAGFAAATYKRGVDYVNVPTTLLAMIDASSGGKTGINYHGLKNSIGVFAQPVETIICPTWLTTLPAEQMLSGYAEMLKTGLLDGTSLWESLLRYDLDTMPIDELTPLIAQCVAAKERIVASDPHEQGPRKALNLGHTFGHALEEMSLSPFTFNPSPLPHGYAVLYGLIAELYLSVIRLGCPKEPLQQLTQIMLHEYGRPQCKCSDREQLIRLMQQDKKNERTAQINCTLIQNIGQPVINQIITTDEANEAWDYLFSL